jgi:hypothetical protein
MATRPFEQIKQVRTDEQAGAMDQANAGAYAHLGASTPQTYTGDGGHRNHYPAPGKPIRQVTQLKSSEQDGTIDSTVDVAYPDTV